MSLLRTPDTRARLDVPSKECRVCQKPFFTTNSLMIVCGLRCAQRIPAFNRQAEKAERKADKAKLEALKTRSDWIKDAQQSFNKYIRFRDAGKPCICCGEPLGDNAVGGATTVGTTDQWVPLRISVSMNVIHTGKESSATDMALAALLTIARASFQELEQELLTTWNRTTRLRSGPSTICAPFETPTGQS